MTQHEIDEFKAFLKAGVPEETMQRWAKIAANTDMLAGYTDGQKPGQPCPV